jgi:hypothetical protein
MTEAENDSLVTRIRNALGCGKDLAGDYAKAIGDAPEVAHGKINVRDSFGRIIAHVPITVLDDSAPAARAKSPIPIFRANVSK